MQLTQENTTLLFHYCKEIADALRPILGTEQFDNVDKNYWIEKLSEFKEILLQILEIENLPSPARTPAIDLENPFLKLQNPVPFTPSPLLDESTQKYLDKIFDKIQSRDESNRYDRILNSVLISLLDLEGSPMTYPDRIITSFDITDQVITELEKRNQ